jgi:hypothetical protein
MIMNDELLQNITAMVVLFMVFFYFGYFGGQRDKEKKD